MIVLTLVLLDLGIVDLLRWRPEQARSAHAAAAFLGATIASTALASLSGLSTGEVALVEAGASIVVLVWVLLDYARPARLRPAFQLGWLALALLGAFSTTGLAARASGSIGHWYAELPFVFARSTSVDRFLLGVAATLFLLATSNRVVRLVLQAAGTPAKASEATLSGGRVLGPMERLFIGAMVITGNLAAAAALIAAKGLLRLPEIRSSTDQQAGASDQVTEYFLVGTFSSLLIASALGALVSVSG